MIDTDDLLRLPAVAREPFGAALASILLSRTGVSSSGHPYLEEAAYEALRDRVPHLLGAGPAVWRAVAELEESAPQLDLSAAERESFTRAAKVVRSVIRTAAITAPSDLWLLRYVLGTLREVGLTERILGGERVDVASCRVDVRGEAVPADPLELEADLVFLLSRGYLLQDHDARFVAPSHPRAVRVLRELEPLPASRRVSLPPLWLRAFGGEALPAGDAALLVDLGRAPPRRGDLRQETWLATLEEIELGWRLLPVVLALRASGRSEEALRDGALEPTALAPSAPEVGAAALEVLAAAGVTTSDGALTAVGRRVLERGAGPMGIIEAYHPYMARLDDILAKGRGEAWVMRGANIAASQDANKRTFLQANDALDRFVADTGFVLRVFLEHAIGRGEATRQRFERELELGAEGVRYFGADLEDAAIDACLEEQRQGRLPRNMEFIRQADIGQPSLVLRALAESGVAAEGAVMMVGNGFHEVRRQTDERMVEVFRAYEEAGVLLLFTEESALSVDDLLRTAWNTYHAGFRYVHEKSGQGLRPADPAPTPRYGRPLRASWSECATRAGYVRADAYSFRSRTVYPTTPAGGHNPSISVNHFFVPGRIAERLRL